MPGETAARYRVIFVEQFANGGLIHYAHSLCNALAARGHDVSLLTGANYELADLPRSFRLLNRLPLWNPYEPSARRRRGLARRLEQIGKALRYTWSLIICLTIIWQRRPEIVHTSEMKFPVDLLLFALPRRFRIVHTCHNVQRFSEGGEGIVRPSRLWYHAQRLMYRRCDGVIFHAARNADEFRHVFRREPALWTTIPHGEYDLFRPQQEVSRQEARQMLGLERDRPLVLFFGALRRYKGLEVLLEAMARLCRTKPDARLVVAGAPLRDVDVERLYRQARRLGLDDVIWRVGYVPHEKVHLYFHACDVVALPYLKAYDSGVLKIAQALGRPAVVTDTGGLAAAVAGGEAGLIVPPGDAERLSQAIENLLSDERLARRLAEQGQALAHTAFSWQSVAGQTERFYTMVVDKRCAS